MFAPTNGHDEFAPFIRKDAFPRNERDFVSMVNQNLEQLSSVLNNFRSAVRLYQFSASINVVPNNYNYHPKPRIYPDKEISDWRFIAARDGAMTLYHFSEVMQFLRNVRARSVSLYENLDHDIYKQANQKMESLVPNLEKIRHSVAHVTDKTRSVELHDKHALRESHKGLGIAVEGSVKITITDSFHGNNFSHNWEGQILSYEVSHKTFLKLAEIKLLMWSAFDKAAEYSRTMPPES